MKIKFHTTKYTLLDNPNISSTRFQATIEKGENSYDDIIADTVNAEEITVYDDNDEIKGIYTGYTKRIAISIIDYISIELANTDIENQINNLVNSVNTLETVQEEQAEAIAELTPYMETKTAYFNESEKTFYNVPKGNITVFFDNYDGDYSISRVSDRVTVSFDTLEQETNITISVK